MKLSHSTIRDSIHYIKLYAAWMVFQLKLNCGSWSSTRTHCAMEFRIFLFGIFILKSCFILQCTAPPLPELEEDNSSKYFFGPTKANWFLAFQFCAFHNMSLVTPGTKAENDGVLQELKNQGSWIIKSLKY